MGRHRLTINEKAGLMMALKSVKPGERKMLKFNSAEEADAAFKFLKRLTAPAALAPADTKGEGL